MSNINKIMAKLSPILSKIGMIESAISEAGGPHFKITRNPEGIVKMLDYASACSDIMVRRRYQDLSKSEYTNCLQLLAEIGHKVKNISIKVDHSDGSHFYRGTKVPNTATAVKKLKDTGSNAASPSNNQKTKTVKTIYRGQVIYKEIPID